MMKNTISDLFLAKQPGFSRWNKIDCKSGYKAEPDCIITARKASSVTSEKLAVLYGHRIYLFNDKIIVTLWFKSLSPKSKLIVFKQVILQLTFLCLHLPANERTRKLRIEYICWRPKSRIWVHQRRNSFNNDVIVDKYPTPISVTCEHLKR